MLLLPTVKGCKGPGSLGIYNYIPLENPVEAEGEREREGEVDFQEFQRRIKKAPAALIKEVVVSSLPSTAVKDVHAQVG